MADELGRVQLEVDVSLQGLVDGLADAQRFAAAADPVELNAKLNTTQLQAQFDKIRLKINDSQVSAATLRVEALSKKVEALRSQSAITLDVSLGKLTDVHTGLDGVLTKLREVRLPKDNKIVVTADTDQATSALTTLSNQLDALTGTTRTINVDVRETGSGVGSTADNIRRQLIEEASQEAAKAQSRPTAGSFEMAQIIADSALGRRPAQPQPPAVPDTRAPVQKRVAEVIEERLNAQQNQTGYLNREKLRGLITELGGTAGSNTKRNELVGQLRELLTSNPAAVENLRSTQIGRQLELRQRDGGQPERSFFDKLAAIPDKAARMALMMVGGMSSDQIREEIAARAEAQTQARRMPTVPSPWGEGTTGSVPPARRQDGRTLPPAPERPALPASQVLADRRRQNEERNAARQAAVFDEDQQRRAARNQELLRQREQRQRQQAQREEERQRISAANAERRRIDQERANQFRSPLRTADRQSQQDQRRRDVSAGLQADAQRRAAPFAFTPPAPTQPPAQAVIPPSVIEGALRQVFPFNFREVMARMQREGTANNLPADIWQGAVDRTRTGQPDSFRRGLIDLLRSSGVEPGTWADRGLRTPPPPPAPVPQQREQVTFQIPLPPPRDRDVSPVLPNVVEQLRQLRGPRNFDTRNRQEQQLLARQLLNDGQLRLRNRPATGRKETPVQALQRTQTGRAAAEYRLASKRYQAELRQEAEAERRRVADERRAAAFEAQQDELLLPVDAILGKQNVRSLLGRQVLGKPLTARGASDAFSNALIGGAFPALFGQGVGASAGGLLGGGIGGLLGGGLGFGGSLVGTALGAQFDQLITKANAAADALKDPINNLQALADAGVIADRGLAPVVATLQSLGRGAEAAAKVQQEVSRSTSVGVRAAQETAAIRDRATRGPGSFGTNIGGLLASAGNLYQAGLGLGLQDQTLLDRLLPFGASRVLPFAPLLPGVVDREGVQQGQQDERDAQRRTRAQQTAETRAIRLRSRGFDAAASEEDARARQIGFRQEIARLTSEQRLTRDSGQRRALQEQINEQQRLSERDREETQAQRRSRRREFDQTRFELQGSAQIQEARRGRFGQARDLAVADAEVRVAEQAQFRARTRFEAAPQGSDDRVRLELELERAKQATADATQRQLDLQRQVRLELQAAVTAGQREVRDAQLGVERARATSNLFRPGQEGSRLAAESPFNIAPLRNRRNDAIADLERGLENQADPAEIERLKANVDTTSAELEAGLIKESDNLASAFRALREQSIQLGRGLEDARTGQAVREGTDSGINAFIQDPGARRDREERANRQLFSEAQAVADQLNQKEGRTKPLQFTFSGTTAERNAQLAEFVQKGREELRGGEDISKIQEELANQMKSLVDINTSLRDTNEQLKGATADLTTATSNLVNKDWRIVVNVDSGAVSGDAVRAIQTATSS